VKCGSFEQTLSAEDFALFQKFKAFQQFTNTGETPVNPHLAIPFLKVSVISGENTIISNTVVKKAFCVETYLDTECDDAYTLKETIEMYKNKLQKIDYITHDSFENYFNKLLVIMFRDMKITEYPIRCSNIRGQTLYLKTEEGWERCSDFDVKKIYLPLAQAVFNKIKQCELKDDDWTDNDANFDFKVDAMKYIGKVYDNEKFLTKILCDATFIEKTMEN